MDRDIALGCKVQRFTNIRRVQPRRQVLNSPVTVLGSKPTCNSFLKDQLGVFPTLRRHHSHPEGAVNATLSIFSIMLEIRVLTWKNTRLVC